MLYFTSILAVLLLIVVIVTVFSLTLRIVDELRARALHRKAIERLS